MSVKALMRKTALKVAGYVEVPVGGKIGMTPERERAMLIQMGFRPVWYPDDPRNPHLFFMSRDGDREATPEEAACGLEWAKESLERGGLTLAEPGDPNGFMVKWKSRARHLEHTESDAVEADFEDLKALEAANK